MLGTMGVKTSGENVVKEMCTILYQKVLIVRIVYSLNFKIHQIVRAGRSKGESGLQYSLRFSNFKWLGITWRVRLKCKCLNLLPEILTQQVWVEVGHYISAFLTNILASAAGVGRPLKITTTWVPPLWPQSVGSNTSVSSRAFDPVLPTRILA